MQSKDNLRLSYPEEENIYNVKNIVQLILINHIPAGAAQLPVNGKQLPVKKEDPLNGKQDLVNGEQLLLNRDELCVKAEQIHIMTSTYLIILLFIFG